MNKMDRYISFLFWGYFIGGLLVFVTIFVAVDMMSTMVQYKGASITSIVKYYYYYAPEVVYKMLPVSCLLSTVLTISNLNRANELVALFACGMSLIRIAMPVIISILIISGVGYIASDKILPVMFKEKNYIFYSQLKKEPGLFSTVKTDRIWYRSKNSIFNIKTLNAKQSKAQGLSLYFFDEKWDLVEMIYSQEVDLLGSKWKLHDGSVTLFTEDTSFPLTRDFKEKVIVMGEDLKDLQNSGKTSEMLSQSELSEFIDRNSAAGLDTIRYRVDYHSKFSFALAGFVMSLLGLAFSTGKARSGGMSKNIGIVIGLVFGYWVIYNSSITLGFHGTLHPIIAAWSANIAMGGFAYWLITKGKK